MGGGGGGGGHLGGAKIETGDELPDVQAAGAQCIGPSGQPTHSPMICAAVLPPSQQQRICTERHEFTNSRAPQQQKLLAGLRKQQGGPSDKELLE